MRDGLSRARKDVSYFAATLLGQPLWPHQREVVESDARQRVICSGRQAGKSTTLSMSALHTAFTKPGSFVLVVSAGEQAARDLLAMCSMLAAGSPWLAGSIVDDNKSEMLLSNGSRIRSIPQSQRQARGPSVDLLVLDECCWIDEGVWTAAKFTAIARPESRIVMASTPWGRQDRFFAVAYRAGRSGVEGYASFHWPSTVSPLVDGALLSQWEATDPARVFRAEVLAEWVDDQGAYFSADELEGAVRDYGLIEPDRARGMRCVGGVDWGFARDASTLVVLASVGARASEFGCDASALFLPYLAEGFAVRYSDWVEKVADVAKGYRFRKIASEMNGVGAMPSQELAAKVGRHVVDPIHTTAALKEDAFGRAKVLLQQGRLILPRHPQLLLQLSALEYEQADSGTLKISVPERRGHDDLCMGLALALQADPSIGVREAFGGGRAIPSTGRQIAKPNPAARSRGGSGRLLTFGDGSQRRIQRGSRQSKIAGPYPGRWGR